MNYLRYLEKEIHSVIMATVDDNGLPVTCAIDIMDSDENGLYFLTAKGNCIDSMVIPAEIKQENCLHCGNCFTFCPQKAVVRRGKEE